MKKQSVIEHPAVVIAEDQGMLSLQIQVQSACGSCHAKQSCMVAETENKIIPVIDDGSYQIGEQVIVLMEENLGFQAVFLGYVWPFVIFLTGLIIGVYSFKHEVIAGLFSILILVPYYLALYWFRDIIKKKFTFRVRAINS